MTELTDNERADKMFVLAYRSLRAANGEIRSAINYITAYREYKKLGNLTVDSSLKMTRGLEKTESEIEECLKELANIQNM